MYILKAYIVKYKNKKRLNKKLFLSYKTSNKEYLFITQLCVIAKITQANI